MPRLGALACSLLVIACSAPASAELNGGGATLPLPLYQRPGVLGAGFAPYLGAPRGDANSAFLYNNYSVLVPDDYSKNVHWIATEEKLHPVEIGDYLYRHGSSWGPLIQVPSAITSVTIRFNKAGAATLNLSVNDVCGIFSGRLTRWEQLPSAGRSGPLQVVYRERRSGTTALFTRFLNAKCSPALEQGTFSVTPVFAGSFSGGLPLTAVSPETPSTASAKTRPDTSESVMDMLNEVDGRITYMSPIYAANSLYELNDGTKVARIDGLSPVPANYSAVIPYIPVPVVTSRNDPSSWIPVFAASASATDPSVVAFPTYGYPIIGFTNLVFSQCYIDATQTSQVRSFFARHFGAITGINNDTAIVDSRLLPLPAAWKAAVRASFLTAASPLAIGNPNVCNGIGRPL